MRFIFLIISLLVSGQLLGQTLLVLDKQGNYLPYFTVKQENENKILIGGSDGRISLEGLKDGNNCGFLIRYLGYKPYDFCLNDLKIGENRILLEEEVLDLEEATIIGLSDQELIYGLKAYLTTMADGFKVTRAYIVEKSDFFVWESFGVITLGGLQDRSIKRNRFEGGNLGFLPQYSRFFFKGEDLSPYKPRMAVISTFTQDLLFDVLKSKDKDWERNNSKNSNEECFILLSHGIEVFLNPNGSPQKIIFNVREFQAPTGKVYQIGGQLDFIQDAKVNFFSALNFSVKDEYLVNISGIIPDFPEEINLPEKFENRNERERLMSAFYSYTASPDYNYDNAVFQQIAESELKGFIPGGFQDFNLLTKNYSQSDLYEGNDPSSKKFLYQNSNFIRAVLKIFRDYELSW